MSDNNSKNTARENLEQTLVCVEQVTRQFDAMTDQLRIDSAEIAVLDEELRCRGNPGLVNPRSGALPAAIQKIEQSLARQKALEEELLAAATTFAQELIKWAEEIEKSEAMQDLPDNGRGIARDPADERAAEARKLAELAQLYLEKAHDEDQQAALAFDAFGMGDEYEGHKLAAKSARDLAGEMQRRAYILTHGQEGNYRSLMLDQYGVNNPDLNDIAAYYAKKFSDQSTLNWLSLQHPAPHPRLDANGLAMMLMFPDVGEGEEAPQAGNAAEKDAFEQVNEVENQGTAAADGVNLVLKYKPGWTDAQRADATAKVQILDDSQTIVTRAQRAGTSAGRRYRNSGNIVSADNDADHKLDLQLGGADTLSNLWPLNSSVNRSLGAQIQQQIKNVPSGTRINNVTIGD